MDFTKLLEVKNLNVSFKIDAGRVLAVNGVSFSLEPGKVLGIVGESGSGKSVTAYSIMGILDKNGRVDSGKINYKGTDLLRLSEKERRDIRGNKISIIFQDAMVSLNPVYTIGNQLREAILTHAKDPIKEAMSSYENEIASDNQRIASLKKGINNHPERQNLKDDLAMVEAKLISDKKTYDEKLVEVTENLKKNEASKKAEYDAKAPELKKVISENRKNYWKQFFKKGDVPTTEQCYESKEIKEYRNKCLILTESLENALNDFSKFKDSFNVSIEDPNYKEKYNNYKNELKARKIVIKGIKKELKKYNRKVRNIVIVLKYNAFRKPAKDAHFLLKTARKAKKDFYWECKSAYRETKWSANKKALATLIDVGITDPEKRLHQYPFELSGGMLQRCMIAMALVQKPDILIADEPTTALDVTIQAQILELLKKLQKEYGMAIIIITHDLGVVAQICDEVDIMYAGRIVERGDVREIFYNPQHEYTKGLIKSMPNLHTEKGRLEPIAGNPVDLFCLPKGCAFCARCKECMDICIDQYPEEIAFNDKHSASCWNMVKKLHEQGKIDVVNGKPEGTPLVYNGAIIAEETNKRNKKNNKKIDVAEENKPVDTPKKKGDSK